MVTPIQRAVETTLKCFARRAGANVSLESIAEIKSHMNQITKAELRIDPRLIEDRIPGPEEPPVTYIKVLEHKLMTVAIFILRQGKRLPLHDHPGMCGFLKVIHGSININSFTPQTPDACPVPASLSERLKQRYGKNIPVYPAVYEGSSIVSDQDDCCVVTPNNKNYHEISAHCGAAAFLDVLTPPYNHKTLADYRPCSYYKELEQDTERPDIRYMVRINPPEEYWCDETDYMGPELLTEDDQDPSLVD